MICDGVNELHDPKPIAIGDNAIRCYCTVCQEQIIIRLDERGTPERRQYYEVFKRHALNPTSPLFDKYYGPHAIKTYIIS